MKRVMFSLICLSLLSMVAQGSLVAHWTMEDGAVGTVATTISDVVGTSDGVIANSGVLGAAFATGYDGTGTSLQILDPAGHRAAGHAYVRTAYGTELYGLDFTVAAWIKPSSTARQTVFSINTTGATQNGTSTSRSFLMEYNNGNLVASNYATSFSSTGGLVVDEWNHVAITHTIDDLSDPTKPQALYSLYINGDFVTSKTLDALCKSNSYGFTLGAYAYSTDANPASYNYSFSGGLDDIRIYDTALTAEEIAVIGIPEPATMAILGLGALLGLRKKR